MTIPLYPLDTTKMYVYSVRTVSPEGPGRHRRGLTGNVNGGRCCGVSVGTGSVTGRFGGSVRCSGATYAKAVQRESIVAVPVRRG